MKSPPPNSALEFVVHPSGPSVIKNAPRLCVHLHPFDDKYELLNLKRPCIFSERISYKHAHIKAMFGDLRFIVIDEFHALLQGDRGLQTFCLIERSCKLAGCNSRRIGLSATLGQPEKAAKFLSCGSGRKTAIPELGKGKEDYNY